MVPSRRRITDDICSHQIRDEVSNYTVRHFVIYAKLSLLAFTPAAKKGLKRRAKIFVVFAGGRHRNSRFIAQLFASLETSRESNLSRNASCNCFLDYCWVRADQILGSLSKGVFERRKSTGSEDFSLLICLYAIKFVLLRFFILVETI